MNPANAMTPPPKNVSASSSDVLTVTSLCKSFGDKKAVDDVSFRVGRNEIVGLLGPNGAGKTTIINMILGVLLPNAGSIMVEGVDAERHRGQALDSTNFAAIHAPLPGNLTVRQNLRVFGMLYKVKNLGARIAELLTQFDLDDLRDKKCGLLSSGEQMRACLAKAMLNQPNLLLLDEPTGSLDPAMARGIRRKIREFAGRGDVGVLWTSHNMTEIEEVCNRVLFPSRGRILLEGDPKRLPDEHRKASLEDLFVAVAQEPLTLNQD